MSIACGFSAKAASDAVLRLLSAAGLLNDGDILPSQAADAVEITVGDGFGLDQLAADAETASPGFEEIGGRCQINAAGRHQTDLRQRAAHCLEESGSDYIGGKDFNDIR